MELFEKIQNDLANKTFEEIMTENLKNFWGYPADSTLSLEELKIKYEKEELKEFVQDISYFERNILDMQKNMEHYKKVYELLQDDSSKKAYVYMMAAKLYMNMEYADKAYFPERIYFSKNIFSFENEIYVDCGGYDGDTALSFMASVPTASKVYIFEGIPEIAETCRKRISNASHTADVTILPKAVYSHSCELKFWSETGTGESKISNDGTICVEATSLDTEIKDRVTFIKMDIEGSEKEALQGAERIIREFSPKMAICIYHLEDDFWKIPELILSINPNYRFFVRQHEPACLSETVLYCVPNDMPNANGETYILNKMENDLASYQQSKVWYIKQLRYKNEALQTQSKSIEELQNWAGQLMQAKEFLETTLEQHKELVATLQNQINGMNNNVEH